jgi:acetyltransferase-like isoleucine patch superfamily enzyme
MTILWVYLKEIEDRIMITINNIKVQDVSVIYGTWKKDDCKYTSPCGQTIIYLRDNCRIEVGSTIGDQCAIGANSTIGACSEIGVKSTIGNCCTIGANSTIGNRCSVGDHCTIGDCSTIRAYSTIGNCSTIGAGSTIGNRCTIGANSTIGSFSIIGDGCIIGDNYNLPVQPLWFSGIKYSIGYHSPGLVKSGCILKPIKWWEENVERCAEEHNYNDVEIKEYKFRIACLSMWMKLWDVYEQRGKLNE